MNHSMFVLMLLLNILKIIECFSFPTNTIPILSSLQKSYINSLTNAPLTTNIITAGLLSVCSDTVSQNIEMFNKNKNNNENILKDMNKKEKENNSLKFSVYRSFCMSIYGSFVLGWFVSLWFSFLNSIIPRKDITLSKVLLKVFINQLVMSPFLNGLFFGYVIMTRDFKNTIKQKLELYKKKISKDLLPTIKRSCVYWSFIHIYNFLILPDKYQLLYTNAAFVLWQTYVSVIGHRKVL